MRTTLTLDEDVANYLSEQTRLQDKPFKQVVNETLRRGMAQRTKGTGAPRFRIRPNRSGFQRGVDPARLNQLIDELDTADFLREAADDHS